MTHINVWTNGSDWRSNEVLRYVRAAMRARRFPEKLLLKLNLAIGRFDSIEGRTQGDPARNVGHISLWLPDSDQGAVDYARLARVVHRQVLLLRCKKSDLTAEQLSCEGPLPAWAQSLPALVPKPRVKKKKRARVPEQVQRAQHARKMLAKAERQVKRWQTQAKKWQRAVKRAERNPVAKEWVDKGRAAMRELTSAIEEVV